MGHKHGRCFIVLGHKYGRHEVKWKHTIGAIHKVPTKVRDAEETLIYDNLLNSKRITKQHISQDEITCFRILETRGKREVAYIRHVSALMVI